MVKNIFRKTVSVILKKEAGVVYYKRNEKGEPYPTSVKTSKVAKIKIYKSKVGQLSGRRRKKMKAPSCTFWRKVKQFIFHDEKTTGMA